MPLTPANVRKFSARKTGSTSVEPRIIRATDNLADVVAGELLVAHIVAAETVDPVPVITMPSNTPDASGNGRHATIFTAPSLVTSPWAGHGSAFSFDGVNDYVDFGATGTGLSASFTVEGKVTPSATIADAANRSILSRYGAAGGAARNYALQQLGSTGAAGQGVPIGAPSFLVTDSGGTDRRVSGPATLVEDQSYDIAATYDASTQTLRLFVDGVLADTEAAVTALLAPDAVTSLLIGQLANTQFWNGILDELRISNVCRYTANYTPSATPLTADANTLLLAHFDELHEWTQIDQQAAFGGVRVQGAAFHRWATANEPTEYRPQADKNDAADGMVAVIYVIEDAEPVDPIEAAGFTQGNAGPTSFAFPSLTTTRDECLILDLLCLADPNPSTIAFSQGVELFAEASTAVTNDVTLGAASRTKAVAGVVPTQTATVLTGVDSRIGFSIAIAPAPPPGEVNIVGEAVFTISGRKIARGGEVSITEDAVFEISGESTGEFTTVLVPMPAKFRLNGTAELEVGTMEDVEEGEVDEGGPVDPPDETLHVIRVIREAPDVTPFFDAATGRVDTDGWTAAFPEEEVLQWGRLRVNVGGTWVSNFRGVPVQVVDWSNAEPFDDKTATIRFPQISPFEELPSWLKRDGSSNVKIVQSKPNGDIDLLFQGIVTSVEDDGPGVVAQCIGALYQLDDWKKKPKLTRNEARDIGDLIASAVTPNARDQRAFRVQSINKVTTGITLPDQGGAWLPLLTNHVAGLLQHAWTYGGDHYTVMLDPDIRRAVMTTKNTTAENYTVHAGEQGVVVSLKYDLSLGTTTMFGEGVSEDNCKWYNAKYPGIRLGDAPIFSGTLIHPDDIHPDFGLFSQELYDRGWSGFDAGGTHYGLHEEVWVREFQQWAGVVVDGIVGPQTWAAAFGVGADNSRLDGAWIAPLFSLPYTEKWLYDASGGRMSENPAFNARKRRIERYVNYDGPVSKAEGLRSAKQEVLRDQDLGLFGTITLNIDPPEGSRFEMKAGRNIRVRNYRGTSPLLHIAEVQVDWSTQTVTLTVDEKARDWMTLAAMRKRDRETALAGRRKETTRQNRSRTISDDKPVWDCENGAGRVPVFALYAGLWSIVRIPAARLGDVVRAYFRVENPTQFSVGIFDVPKRPADMLLGHDVPGHEGEEVGNPLYWHGYWKQFGEDLLIHWGDSENPGGWSPFTGPEDDDPDAQITGTIDDRGSWYFESRNPPWLWVAIWAEPSETLDNNIAYVQGVLQPSNALV